MSQNIFFSHLAENAWLNIIVLVSLGILVELIFLCLEFQRINMADQIYFEWSVCDPYILQPSSFINTTKEQN